MIQINKIVICTKAPLQASPPEDPPEKPVNILRPKPSPISHNPHHTEPLKIKTMTPPTWTSPSRNPECHKKMPIPVVEQQINPKIYNNPPNKTQADMLSSKICRNSKQKSKLKEGNFKKLSHNSPPLAQPPSEESKHALTLIKSAHISVNSHPLHQSKDMTGISQPQNSKNDTIINYCQTSNNSGKLMEEKIHFAKLKNALKIQFKMQGDIWDNSGASFLTIVAHKGVLFAGNCGSSEALCMTKTGKLLKLAKSHTTANDQQVDRIVNEGGKLYQTIVNLPYRKQMGIKGPLRVYPEGLTLTRTIGKSISKQKKRVHTVSDSVNYRKGIISQLQIQYVPISEVRWLIILSSKIADRVRQPRIKEIIEQQLAKRSIVYHQGEAAEHSCKRIILQAAQSGATQSLSAIIIFGQIQSQVVQTEQSTHNIKQPSYRINSTATDEKLIRQPRSLKYIGKRINFVEMVNDQ